MDFLGQNCLGSTKYAELGRIANGRYTTTYLRSWTMSLTRGFPFGNLFVSVFDAVCHDIWLKRPGMTLFPGSKNDILKAHCVHAYRKEARLLVEELRQLG